MQVDVLVPGGKHADQPLVRVASRHWFGELLRGGVQVHEYQASMIHQKLLIVDDWWVVMGTTNMDNRSFEHNDEINVAFPDEGLRGRFRAVLARPDSIDTGQPRRVAGAFAHRTRRVTGRVGVGQAAVGSGFRVPGSEFMFRVQVPSSASEFRFRVQVPSSGSEFRFRVQVRVRVLNPNPSS